MNVRRLAKALLSESVRQSSHYPFTAKQARISPLALKECHTWARSSSIIGRFAVTIEGV